jgi:hypothetical protein
LGGLQGQRLNNRHDVIEPLMALLTRFQHIE